MPAPRLTADTLRELCAQLNVGQRAAARLAHIDEALFRRMCRGTRPVTLDVVVKLRDLVEARARHSQSSQS